MLKRAMIANCQARRRSGWLISIICSSLNRKIRESLLIPTNDARLHYSEISGAIDFTHRVDQVTFGKRKDEL